MCILSVYSFVFVSTIAQNVVDEFLEDFLRGPDVETFDKIWGDPDTIIYFTFLNYKIGLFVKFL